MTLETHATTAAQNGQATARVGVIGCGRIAERHVDAYRKLGATVVVADQDPAAAQRLAEAQRVAWRGSPDDLLDDPELDAIDVCVPTAAHASVVLAALERGKHVFCEKPLCRTYEEAEAIAAAQRESGRLVMVGYLYRFHPAFQFAKQVLEDGIIGRPYFAIFRLGGRGSHRAWKHTTESGGGATLEMMVHNLDLIQWLLGCPDEVDLLRRSTLLPERQIGSERVRVNAEDYVLARLRVGDVEVVCESDLVTPSYMNYVEIQGDNGSLFTSILHYLPTIVYCKEPHGVFNLGNNTQQFPPVNLFERELGHFLEALRSDRTPMNGVSESLQLMAVIERIREGSPVGGN